MINCIPSGTKNLHNLFPAIVFKDVREYYVEALTSSNEVLATTPMVMLQCRPENSLRVHFLNALGQFDALNFRNLHILHEDKSEEFKRGLKYPLKKTDTQSERFNIRSNDTYSVTYYGHQTDAALMQELANSPLMFIEWEGTEGQDDSFIPILKVDGKLDLTKNEQEYQYIFTMSFVLSNEYFTFRN